MDFTRSEDTRELYQKILGGWRHASLPERKRFLGSLVITQNTSNQLLKIVGVNLRSHLKREGNITYSSLCDRFDVQKNWVKIITAALSEYAYYYSNSEQGFWEGFCNCQLIKIPYNQGTANTLREISKEGSKLLGLVKAKRKLGHAHVSTLWLQSGIPQKNLVHFAELVQGVAYEYGWWELAHTSERLLSQELLEFCQDNHAGRGTLIGFLKISCSDIEKVEPISGQLVQGIATVALELERNNESPDILRNVNQRENILRNYYLPKHFFLRDWDNLIQVLTQTKYHRIPHRKIIKTRKKALSLVLDIFNTGNIQLVLPEQNLRESNWSSLLGRYCRIPDFISGYIWEGNIPHSNSEFLNIPEQIINPKNIEIEWRLCLLDDNNNELVSWHQERITEALPCLVFDASLGTHISLDGTKPVISITNEVVCFVPKDVKLKLNNEIYILSNYVPCSISGWYGQHIQLLSHNSEIVLTKMDRDLPIAIAWRISDNQQPVLRGLKIKARKEVYLEAPTFWHPPTSQNLCFYISIDDLINQETVSRTSVDIYASDRWQNISLEEMIKTPSKYQVRFWNEAQQYSFSFELRSEHQISEAIDLNTLQISRRKDNKDDIVEIPIQCDRTEQFWAETITIRGLWTLEKVTLTLSNGDSKISCLIHADKSGTVAISLSTLYGKLPDSDWYALDYQRSGIETQRLVELAPQQPISYTWAKTAIHLSGLQTNQNYSLVCWNLLIPSQEPERIRVQNKEQDTITVALNLNAGIYHIQIQGRSLQDLGCWSGDEKPILPQLDEDIEDYCYTILGNESTQSFMAASQKLAINRQRTESMLSSLQTSPYYFPEWLSHDSLLEKLETFLIDRKTVSISRSDNSEFASPSLTAQRKLPPRTLPQPIALFTNKQPAKWYLVQTKSPKARNTFQAHLKILRTQEDIDELIVEVGFPDSRDYPDYVLVRLNDYEKGCEYLRQINGFKTIVPKLPSMAQVNKMLGRE